MRVRLRRTLIVQVTWEDIDNTPANDVYVEAYGFVSEVRLSKSFVLKMQNKGQYQASLPAGVYDLLARYADSTTNAIVRTGVSLLGGRFYTVAARGDITITSTTATNRPFLDATANR